MNLLLIKKYYCYLFLVATFELGETNKTEHRFSNSQ
jgi:hypothetical protein